MRSLAGARQCGAPQALTMPRSTAPLVETRDSAVREGLRPDPAARHHLGRDLVPCLVLVARRGHRAGRAARALLVHLGAGENAHGMPNNLKWHVGLG